VDRLNLGVIIFGGFLGVPVSWSWAFSTLLSLSFLFSLPRAFRAAFIDLKRILGGSDLFFGLVFTEVFEDEWAGESLTGSFDEALGHSFFFVRCDSSSLGVTFSVFHLLSRSLSFSFSSAFWAAL